MKLKTSERVWLFITAICAAAAIAVTAASRTPASAATVALAPMARSAAPETVSPTVKTVDINTATAKELDALPGIGAKLAERIIAYRTEHGAFGSIEDIMKVSGIGAGKFEKIRDSIMVTQEDGA